MIKKIINISEKILPKFLEWKKQWDNPEDMSVRDYVSFNVHPEEALMVGAVLQPTFREVDGCIFLDDKFEENNYRQWRKEFDGNKGRLEKLINHVHIYDLFANCNEDVEDDVFEKFGELLKTSYSLALKAMYPEREFIVSLTVGDMDYGPVLLFFEKETIGTLSNHS